MSSPSTAIQIDPTLRVLLWEAAQGLCLDCGAAVTPRAVQVKDGSSGSDAGDYWVSCGHRAAQNPTPEELKFMGGFFVDVAKYLDPKVIRSLPAGQQREMNLMLSYYDGLKSKDPVWSRVATLRQKLLPKDATLKSNVFGLHREFDTQAFAAIKAVAGGEVPGVSMPQHILNTWKRKRDQLRVAALQYQKEAQRGKSDSVLETQYSSGESDIPAALTRAESQVGPFFASLGFTQQDVPVISDLKTVSDAGRLGKTSKERDIIAARVAEKHGIDVNRVKLILDLFPFVREVEAVQYTTLQDAAKAATLSRDEKRAVQATQFGGSDVEANMMHLLTRAGFDTSRQESQRDTARPANSRKVQ
jgi:hypothetical protein